MDVPGNEIADRRAKKGAETNLMEPEPFLSVIKRSGTTSGLSGKPRRQFPEYHLNWNNNSQTSSPKERRLALQIYTGHGNVEKYNHLTGRSSVNICQKCGEEAETGEHYVCRCPAYMHLRRIHFGYHEVDITVRTS